MFVDVVSSIRIFQNRLDFKCYSKPSVILSLPEVCVIVNLLPAQRPLYFRPDIRNQGRGGPSHLPRGVSIAWILSDVFWSLHSEKFLHLAQSD